MTLVDVLPSLRASSPPRLTPDVWPCTASRTKTDLWIGGVSVTEIAEQHCTPCYVFDEIDVRHRCQDLRAAFGSVAVSYAAQAMNSPRVLRWIAQEGLGINVSSAGEIAAAQAAGFDGARMTLSGPKTPTDLRAALDSAIGRIVVESPSEIRRLAAYANHPQQVLLRVSLGARASDGTGRPADSGVERLGLSPANGELDNAITALAGQPHLQLVGLDYHIGSQVARFERYEHALRQLVDLLSQLNGWHGLDLGEINLGGGLTVHPDGYRRLAVDAFATPRVTATAGRAVVARAGIALYRLLSVRRDPDGHQLVAIDGGLADNSRRAPYGDIYTPILIGRAATAHEAPTTIISRYGEPGDVIARNVPLPGDLRPGDLIAVADCGAYHYAMASNYGLVPRPPVVGVRDGADPAPGAPGVHHRSVGPRRRYLTTARAARGSSAG